MMSTLCRLFLGTVCPFLTSNQFISKYLTDYGESHYIGPIKGAQPNSEAWVNGFDHLGWLHLCGYFARIFKSRMSLTSNPGDYDMIKEDQLYVWSRPHSRDVKVHEDTVGRPKGWELVSLCQFPYDLF